jgi:predicted nucleic acid-binding protein
MQISMVEISQGVIMEAIQLAYFHAITVYDATFIAIIAMAKYLKVPFITADEKLIQDPIKIPYVHHISDLTNL